MEVRNQKIIDAIKKKAEINCPGSLALIGIYGSVATGDVHAKSDLDLMILINNESGRCLSDTFILDDADIGYDIYCTSWEMLEADAKCDHAHLSKLLDSKLVYVSDASALERLETLQRSAFAILSSEERYGKAQNAFRRATEKYGESFLMHSLSEVRFVVGNVIYELLNSLMLYHGRYFQKGVKRTFDEINALNLPFDMQAMVLAVIRGETVQQVQNMLTPLMLAVKAYLVLPNNREKPCVENLAGTYEEIYSNWRNKLPEAAENRDLYSSFMNMANCHNMMNEIVQSVMIQNPELLGQFDPHNLHKNAEAFDEFLHLYLKVYEAAGIQLKRYGNIDEFLAAYHS